MLSSSEHWGFNISKYVLAHVEASLLWEAAAMVQLPFHGARRVSWQGWLTCLKRRKVHWGHLLRANMCSRTGGMIWVSFAKEDAADLTSEAVQSEGIAGGPADECEGG